MRKLVATFVCLGLCAGVANAQPPYTIQFYFSEQGTLDAIPPEFAAESTPEVLVGDMVYMWALVPEETVDDLTIWNNTGLDFNLDTCGSLQGMGGVVHNYDLDYGAGIRWNPGADFDPSDGTINPMAVTEAGLGHQLDLGQVGGSMGGTGHYLLGEFIGNVEGDYFLAVGNAGVARRGGTAGGDFVQFGFGDDPLLNNAFGECSDLPDLIVIPEPASLLLLGISGLALLRRR